MTGRPKDETRAKSCVSGIWMAAIALLVLLLGGSAAMAQILYGSLTGTITDKTGAVIPNVSVTVTNQGTGEVRTVKAGGQGSYDVLDVLPGTYTISVAPAGNFGDSRGRMSGWKSIARCARISRCNRRLFQRRLR